MNNLPDPGWDYSPLYTHLLLAKSALDNAIATVSKAETANDTTDDVLIESLEALQGETLSRIDNAILIITNDKKTMVSIVKNRHFLKSQNTRITLVYKGRTTSF